MILFLLVFSFIKRFPGDWLPREEGRRGMGEKRAGEKGIKKLWKKFYFGLKFNRGKPSRLFIYLFILVDFNGFTSLQK